MSVTNRSQAISEYLDRFRVGERERAFFGLLELPRGTLPELMDAYRGESDRGVRAFLVEVIWRRREESSIPFVGSALFDASPQVWKQALDGLVTLASPAAVRELEVARERRIACSEEAGEFLHWIDEAIDQVRSRVE